MGHPGDRIGTAGESSEDEEGRALVLATLTPEGRVGGGLGRADEVVLLAPDDHGHLQVVERVVVGWGKMHGLHAEGLHHAMVAKFLQSHDVDTILTGHVGPGMAHMLGTMGIQVLRMEGQSLEEAVASYEKASGVSVRTDHP